MDIGAAGWCGVDEVGRGCLAGDVLAAAVILDPSRPVAGLADSKRLSAARRERLYGEITARAAAWAVGRATVAEIDRLNILQASLLAMHRAVAALAEAPELVLVDGNRLPDWPYAARAVIGGDATIACISAAAILAKVTRDREMQALEADFPGYGFARHKGYGTAQHSAALDRLGPCALHRRSFAPVRRACGER
ncbi:MAG TPA: ribonuclease HII [Porticoccaceae bacterium]|nr:ribonuclease HII [Porticoccaceae bacterium]